MKTNSAVRWSCWYVIKVSQVIALSILIIDVGLTDDYQQSFSHLDVSWAGAETGG